MASLPVAFFGSTYPAHLPLGLFWRHLADAVLDDDTLTLAHDTVWLGDNSCGSRLYVREAYKHVFALISRAIRSAALPADWATLRTVQAAKHHNLNRAHMVFDCDLVTPPSVPPQRWLLTGTSGIGKSFSFLYMLWQLARARKTCWYKCPMYGGGNWLVFTFVDGVPVVQLGHTSDSFMIASAYPGNVFVYDSCEKVDLMNALTIVISSPKRTRYQDFEKSGGVERRYLPVWTLDELEACRGVCYPALPSKEMRRLFRYAGGIARVVLQHRKLRTVEEAVLSADLYKLLATASLPDTGDDMCHRLLHIQVEADLQTTLVGFPSEAVAEKIAQRLVLNQSLFSRWFIHTIENPGLQRYRGTLFDKHAHALLCTGGIFRARRLDSDGSGSKRKGEESRETVELPSSALQQTLTDVTSPTLFDDVYVRPLKKNFPSIDSLLPSHCAFFHMTVSTDNPIYAKPLADLINAYSSRWSGTGPVRLYFVVPSDAYSSFRKQPYRNVSGKVRLLPLSGSTDVLGAEIQQWVLEVSTDIMRVGAVGPATVSGSADAGAGKR